jgi:hypothetical protein
MARTLHLPCISQCSPVTAPWECRGSSGRSVTAHAGATARRCSPSRSIFGAVTEWLIDHELLAAWDSGDRGKVRTALESALRLWSSYETG